MAHIDIDYPYYMISATQPDSSQYTISLKVYTEQGPFSAITPDQIADGLRDFLSAVPNVTVVSLNKITEALTAL